MPEPTSAKPWWRRWFGTRSERAAAKFLKRKGLRILKQNHQSPLGELDIVALDGQCIVFVEVRSTERDSTEFPAASVGHDKQQRLTRLALAFMQNHCLLAVRRGSTCWPSVGPSTLKKRRSSIIRTPSNLLANFSSIPDRMSHVTRRATT